MKENLYDNLCKFCDDIIFHEKSSYRISNSFLHVIREHPIFLKKYKDIFKNENHIFFNIKNILRFIKNLLLFLINLKNCFIIKRNIPRKEIDVLFISHLLNEKQLNSKEDFYFGDISKK